MNSLPEIQFQISLLKIAMLGETPAQVEELEKLLEETPTV
jgi:hypothetical protein